MINNIIQDFFHPVLIRLMKSQRKQRKQQLFVLNEPPVYKGICAIYAVNHSCRYDFPITSEVISYRMNVLVGKQRLDLIDRICFRLNGVVYVDRHSSESKKAASKKIQSLLKQGQNLCIYLEGTWNLTSSKPLLPLYWGIIDIAREAACPIIPLVLEYRENDCYVKFGTPVYVAKEDNKQTKIDELSDKMASLRWDIWEKFPVVSRTSVDQKEWEREVRKRIAEYPKLDYEYEKSCVRKV